jgi:hypothetical protein
MTNKDILLNKFKEDTESMAESLIITKYIPVDDYYYDEDEAEDNMYCDFYTCSDECAFYDHDSALAHEVEWLNAEERCDF